jgi:hypothetical protein
MRVPEQSPLASEVLSGAMIRDFVEADIVVKCPTCAIPVAMDTADVALNDDGSAYYCANGCRPATMLLRAEKVNGRWTLDAPHGYRLDGQTRLRRRVRP